MSVLTPDHARAAAPGPSSTPAPSASTRSSAPPAPPSRNCSTRSRGPRSSTSADPADPRERSGSPRVIPNGRIGFPSAAFSACPLIRRPNRRIRSPAQAFSPTPARRLTRSTSDKHVAGVAGGLGQYFGVDPIIFRIAFVAAALVSGIGIVAYIALTAFLPSDRGETAWIEGRSRITSVLLIGALCIAGLTMLAPPAFFFGPAGRRRRDGARARSPWCSSGPSAAPSARTRRARSPAPRSPSSRSPPRWARRPASACWPRSAAARRWRRSRSSPG